MAQTVRPHCEFIYSDEDTNLSLEFVVSFTRVPGGFEDVSFELQSIGSIGDDKTRSPRRHVKDESIALFEKQIEAAYADRSIVHDAVNRAIRNSLERD